MKGEMAVVGERDRATKERVMRILGVIVGRVSSEDFMILIILSVVLLHHVVRFFD